MERQREKSKDYSKTRYSMSMNFLKLLLVFSLVISCKSDVGKQDEQKPFKTYPGLVVKDELYYSKGAVTPFTGSTESNYDNGNPFVKANFKNGKLHGKYTAYYANGQKMGISHYRKGKKHGKSVGWFENGQMGSKIDFENGKKDGLLIVYYPNGKKRMEAFYRAGQLDGSLTLWQPTGKLHSIKSYSHGELKWEDFYNQDSIEEQDSL